MNIEMQLDQLANLQAQADVIRLQFIELRRTIITPEIQAQLDELDAEMLSTLEPVTQATNDLTEAIKENVITTGASVKGTFLQAVYSKPRVTWDNKGLDGFMVAHPEIKAFRKEGEPSVSIRSVK
jgi:hypothetical protein